MTDGDSSILVWVQELSVSKIPAQDTVLYCCARKKRHERESRRVWVANLFCSIRWVEGAAVGSQMRDFEEGGKCNLGHLNWLFCFHQLQIVLSSNRVPGLVNVVCD